MVKQPISTPSATDQTSPVQQSDPSPSSVQASSVQQADQSPASNQAAYSLPATSTQPVPVQWTMAQPTLIDLASPLRNKPRVTVAFPPCSDELLSLIKTTDDDDITATFKDYFKFRRHKILGQDGSGSNLQELDQQLGDVLDPNLLNCPDDGVILHSQSHQWPSGCCLCTPCVTLDGARNPPPPPLPQPQNGVRRLHIGDVPFLFFHVQMGIPQILGAILDAFATTGRLPISNGSLHGGVRDDITALILEIMVRQIQMGMAPTVRSQGALFRTTIGWQSRLSRDLNLDTEVNTGFSTLFHQFIYHALEFYRDKRLAVAIQGTLASRPSVATLITIRDTIDILKKRFEAFDYGRNYYNTLAGIVWTISAMSIIRELRGTLGIPTAYDATYEFIPAAYDILVLKRPVTRGEINLYTVHRECALNSRDILLDLEVLDYRNPQALENWLNQIEPKVEGYRTAYRQVTDGVDLGKLARPAVDQQA